MNNHNKVMLGVGAFAAVLIAVLLIVFKNNTAALLPLFVLICPISMIVMMVFMGKSHKR